MRTHQHPRDIEKMTNPTGDKKQKPKQQQEQKQLLVYERPLALNRKNHRDLRIRARTDGFTFAAKLNSVPLVCGEFSLAARDYPIVFAGTKADICTPAALLGLVGDDNLFVSQAGQWAEGVHIPAFLRRYPFVVAQVADADADFTVCIDEAVVSDSSDAVRLFDEEGNNTPALEQALRFLADYQGQVQNTRTFVEALNKHGLLVERTVKVQRADQTMQMHGFSVVDEEKLQSLDGDALADLSKTGALGLAYVHLMSLSNVQRLANRLDSRKRVQPAH